MSTRLLLFLLAGLVLLLPACGDDDGGPAGAGDHLLGSYSFSGGGAGTQEYDVLTFTMTLTDAPAIEIMNRMVHSGDESRPGKNRIVVMDSSSPVYADVVARLTDGNPDQIQLGQSNAGGSSSNSGPLQVLFDLPASDFAGQELTQIRFVVNEVLIEPRPGGGSQSTYSVTFQFLGR